SSRASETAAAPAAAVSSSPPRDRGSSGPRRRISTAAPACARARRPGRRRRRRRAYIRRKCCRRTVPRASARLPGRTRETGDRLWKLDTVVPWLTQGQGTQDEGQERARRDRRTETVLSFPTHETSVSLSRVPCPLSHVLVPCPCPASISARVR